MRENEVVVGKRECELMFQIVWVLRAGIDLASHPPRVLADRQVVAFHPIRIDHAADRRRPQGRFDLHGGPVDDAGGHLDHPTVRAFFYNDRVAQVRGWVTAGVGEKAPPTLPGGGGPPPQPPPKGMRAGVPGGTWQKQEKIHLWRSHIE